MLLGILTLMYHAGCPRTVILVLHTLNDLLLHGSESGALVALLVDNVVATCQTEETVRSRTPGRSVGGLLANFPEAFIHSDMDLERWEPNRTSAHRAQERRL